MYINVVDHSVYFLNIISLFLLIFLCDIAVFVKIKINEYLSKQALLTLQYLYLHTIFLFLFY